MESRKLHYWLEGRRLSQAGIAGREAALAVTDVRRAPAPELIGCRCSACSCWLRRHCVVLLCLRVHCLGLSR